MADYHRVIPFFPQTDRKYFPSIIKINLTKTEILLEGGESCVFNSDFSQISFYDDNYIGSFNIKNNTFDGNNSKARDLVSGILDLDLKVFEKLNNKTYELDWLLRSQALSKHLIENFSNSKSGYLVPNERINGISIDYKLILFHPPGDKIRIRSGVNYF